MNTLLTICVLLISIPAAAIFDRYRGSSALELGKTTLLKWGIDVSSRNIEKLCLAIAVYAAWMHVHHGLTALPLYTAFLVCYMIAVTPGFTDAIGAVLEGRDYHPDARPKWWAPYAAFKSGASVLLVRGFLWGMLPAAAIHAIVGWPTTLSFLAVFGTSYYIPAVLARHTEFTYNDYVATPWHRWEIIRGVWVATGGAITSIITLLN